MELGDIMRAQRQRFGMSQSDLAKASSLSLRQIARYESGEQQPALTAAIRMANVLGISLDELAGLEETDYDLSGLWWISFYRDFIDDDDMPIRTQAVTAIQRGQKLMLDADDVGMGDPPGSFPWRGELRIWDNEALVGWFRASETDHRDKGTLYFQLDMGQPGIGIWTGFHSGKRRSHSGWAALGRNPNISDSLVHELVHGERPKKPRYAFRDVTPDYDT